MAVGEIILSAFITVLFEKLASSDMMRLARYAGILSKLENLRSNLLLIQAVLVDAGQKHISDTSVELWLNELHHLAYEIEDVFDDLVTEATRRRLKNQESDASTSNNTKSKVLKFIPNKFHAVNYGRKMSPKIDEITTKLRGLVEKKKILGLKDNVERSSRPRKRLEETSLVDESKVIGRKGDKEALLGMLLGSESSSTQTTNVNVVSVVGLGGIGKTTLAQLLYNDEKVKVHFEFRAWVCVSDEFDVLKISKAIFQAVGGGNQDFANLNLLQEALKEKLSKKMFLLVMDDVWNENHQEWELLQRPFTVGAPGSKVLVTTRNTTVASAMDSVQPYDLELLPDEEALSLFSQHASDKQNFDDVNRKLKLYGDKIVKKCGRLPLALKTLGRVFRGKSDEEWEELLDSEIWNSKNESNILPALMLSYYDLPPHLKQIFAYCSLFPKDYVFDKDELVLLWMAEGFLYQPNEDKQMEILGGEYFKELVSRSFFQSSTIFSILNDKSCYTMHDLINDMAKSVAGEFFFMVDDKMDVYERKEALKKCHHLSFLYERYGAYKKFKALEICRGLRTFLVMPARGINDWGGFYISNRVLIEVIPLLKSLRVLNLADYNITHVPESIGRLQHLRYLNLSGTQITCLPEQVGDLHNLQSLLLSRCYRLSSLPASIVKLTNLRHLDISYTNQLKKMPLGLGGLTSLQTLSKVVIGEADEFNICDLKGLVHLQGQLEIKELQKVKKSFQAKEAELRHKKGIHELDLRWSDVFDDSRNEATEYEVLEGLRPFKKLTSLSIWNYGGREFPSWVGDLSFDCLTHLKLIGCKSCTCLPALGHLPSLQELHVRRMDGLKSVGSEFLGPSNGVAFPSLKALIFLDMKGWEKWSTIHGGKGNMFPCLLEIFMSGCEKLDEVAIESIPSLQVLRVEGCSEIVLKSMVGVSSSIVRLTLENIRGLTQLPVDVLEHLEKVEDLFISKCDEVTCMWDSEAACKILLKLKKLEVYECKQLLSLGETNMPSITKVSLDISRCNNVEVGWLDKNFLSSLQHLYISHMVNLRLFPDGCFVHLTTLNINDCDNLESIPSNGYGFLPSHCLRYLKIADCKNLKSFPHEHLQSFESLEKITIYGCPNLDYTFPGGLWPPNLSELRIGKLKKPISEWGMQNFPTSLDTLELFGEDSGVVTFAKAGEEDTSFLLPSSLTSLSLFNFNELESLSEGMQHLTCLQHLEIRKCPKLRDLPETLLPSLSSLQVRLECSEELRKKCSKSKKGKYWPIISQIPNLDLGSCFDN
ncbi:hypothetical protein E3N88_31899 [Mikania micrantha]|uniref:NB-ARC domain-containing protein n=1 Tax=Mikania micrantha TaxID=192012 RepID=A0A5N6M6Z2_9ASTR|nr:hypothetical protein E3N88_31899 [Mikania micrantha]